MFRDKVGGAKLGFKVEGFELMSGLRTTTYQTPRPEPV